MRMHWDSIPSSKPGLAAIFSPPHIRWNVIKTRFMNPYCSDWRNFETWYEDGSRSALERANTIWKQILREYEKPPIDPAVDDELKAYIAKRKEQIKQEGA